MAHLFCGMSAGVNIGWAGSENALNDKIRSPEFSRHPENEQKEESDEGKQTTNNFPRWPFFLEGG